MLALHFHFCTVYKSLHAGKLDSITGMNSSQLADHLVVSIILLDGSPYPVDVKPVDHLIFLTRQKYMYSAISSVHSVCILSYCIIQLMATAVRFSLLNLYIYLDFVVFYSVCGQICSDMPVKCI